MKAWAARDRRAIWHPYTQMHTADPPLVIARGEGAYLIAEDGRRYLDGISSWWTNLHGHAHPAIAARIAAQAAALEHVIFAGCTHAPAIELAERLLAILPKNQARIFYSDDGSTAVETALKMALQYWAQRGDARGEARGEARRRFVALRGAYHGDTFGAMSVSDRGAFARPFEDLLFETAFIELPSGARLGQARADLERELAKGGVAAFIFEPLLQGAAGFRTYPAAALDELIALARRHGALAIADEVLTGFGRTGKLFAADHLREAPDIVCMSKGLTGGAMALGATSCTNEIFEAFLSEDRRRAFLHGHSYSGNPIACAAALASLDLLLAAECRERIAMIARSHAEFARRARGHARVREARSLGTALALELELHAAGDESYFAEIGPRLARFYLERGILLRPLGNVAYTLPPYCVTEAELHRIYDVIEESLERV
ncbi:MAG: adenosylmethionine--8-amino-7-oxononanoate transaminase [Planctomycetes bacterium]|nr:adenosylmethionine--8-amino-7-oxononanoate transaminase [Planctomycetota bacterium]